ncbi:MAG TPA: hypothetical protein VIX20_08145 [Ktedonobacteraceae bacterium]
MFLKCPRPGSYGMAAMVIIICALIFRVALTAPGLPTPNSDEGAMGLEAMHIAFRGEHPIFLYGQNYMGVLEAYIGAGAFHLFGVSLFSLRLSMLMLFTLFLVSLYFLTSLLYTKKLALVTLLLLSFASPDMLIQQLRAVGGAVETLLFGTLTLLLASWLALSSRPQAKLSQNGRRLAAYACLGFVMGFGLWCHVLILPFLLAGLLLLLLFCRQELFTRWSLLLLAAFLIGVAPIIIQSLRTPQSNVLLTAWNLFHTPSIDTSQATLARRLSSTFLYGLPVGTGLTPLCASQELPTYGPATLRTLPCALEDGAWSLGYLALLLAAYLLSALPLWRLWRLRRVQAQVWLSKEHETVILQCARLLLLSSATITLALYIMSPITALKPWSTRYLVGLLVATPALIWPLWRRLASDHRSGYARRLFLVGSRSCALLLISSVLSVSTVVMIESIPAAITFNQNDASFIQSLQHLGVRHFYANYWICYRLMFMSKEQLICGGRDRQLQPIGNRYPLYPAVVDNDSHAAYVYAPDDPDDLYFAQKLRQLGILYRDFTIDGYHVYLPARGLYPGFPGWDS